MPCSPPCAGATPPSGTWAGCNAGPGPPSPDLAVTTDIIVGFPGETEDDFERTLEVAAEASYDSAYTFIFSPRPGNPGGGHGRSIRTPRRGGPSASSGSAAWWSDRRCSVTATASARVEEVLVEGPLQAEPRRAHRSHRPEQSWCTSRTSTVSRCGRGAYATVAVVDAGPVTTSPGCCVR